MTQWTDNAEAKTSTAAVLGGVLTVRRGDDNALVGLWVGAGRIVDVATSQPETGEITVQIPLHDCASVADAKVAVEARLRESLEKTHPLAFADATDAEKAAQASEPEPY